MSGRAVAAIGGIVSAAGGIAAAFNEGMNIEDASKKLQAQLGLSDADAAKAGKTASSVYTQAWG